MAVASRNGGLLKIKSKIQEEARFQILRHLHNNPELSQRELGDLLGVSLGSVNYCLRALIDLGFVKAKNFKRSTNKISYAYVLTPAGISEKASLTTKFLKYKVAEYEALRSEIAELEREYTAMRKIKSINPEEIS